MNNPHPGLVVVAASAGGISCLQTILYGLDERFPGPIVVAQHRSPAKPSALVPVLRRHTQ